jgi:hypothetical protein
MVGVYGFWVFSSLTTQETSKKIDKEVGNVPLVPLESPQEVHWGGLVLWLPMVWELLNSCGWKLDITFWFLNLYTSEKVHYYRWSMIWPHS